MKYIEFKNRFSKFPIISSYNVYNINKSLQVLKNQLTIWQKKGLILKLRKGLYVLNEDDRKIHPSRIFLANQIYSPSYISCEYALYFYNLIPEKAEDVTSVTTKKTSYFKNVFGVFKYHSIKLQLFSGFTKILDENNYPVLIAEPEKAVLDFLYFNINLIKGKSSDIFKYSYRFQNLSKIKEKKLSKMAGLFQDEKFMKVVRNFIIFMRDAK